jgi:hypothetical protein
MVDGGDDVAVAGEVLGERSVLGAVASPARTEEKHGKGRGRGGYRSINARVGVEQRCVERGESCFAPALVAGDGIRGGRGGIPELDDEGAARGGIVRFGARGVSEREDGGAGGEGAGGRGQREAIERNDADDDGDQKPDGKAEKKPAEELGESEATASAPSPV